MWYKIQSGISIIIGCLLSVALLGGVSLYLSGRGILSQNAITGFFIILLVPLSVIILGCFIFSSGLIILAVGKYLFSGQLSDVSKQFLFVHSIYELFYLLFFLFIVLFKAGSSIE
jgi:hypothetical protein